MASDQSSDTKLERIETIFLLFCVTRELITSTLQELQALQESSVIVLTGPASVTHVTVFQL